MEDIKLNESKPKSIIINGQLHKEFKTLCKGKNMKIGAVIEDLIRMYLNDPKNLEKMIEELKGTSSYAKKI